MALLDDLETPCELVFVGGDPAKRLAQTYHGQWIQNTPTLEDDLRRFWDLR
jgi:hypothetical protein